MENNSIKANLKAGILDFIIPIITFFSVYYLTFEIINEENYIKTALIYLLFFVCATAYILIKRRAFHPEAILTGTVCIVLAVALALHGSFYIIPMLMAASALYCLSLTRSNLHTSGSYLYGFDLLVRTLITPLVNLFLPLKAMWNALKGVKKSRRNFGVLAGLLLAVPLLSVLFILLMNSDAAFESAMDSFMNKLTDFLPDFDGAFYAFSAFLFTPYIVSVLFCFAHGIDSERGKNLRGNIKKLRFASGAFLGGFLGSVCLLYVVYLLSQTAYFFSAFGGKLPDGTEITLSEYARRGFFEMSAIAAINLGLIGTGAIFSKRKEESFTKIFKGISLFLCLFTMVLITTAMSKMLLYIGEMGLTHKRLAVAVINVVMFLAFVFVIIRLFKNSFPYFRYIMAVSISVVTLFTLISPDAIIGYYNTEAYLSGKHESIDIDLLDYQLEAYYSIKSLYKLKDDPAYGIAAKSRLDDYYTDSEPYFPRTVKGYMAEKFVEANKEDFKKFYDEYHPFFDWEISDEITEPEIPSTTEIFFHNNSDKAINEVSVFDSVSNQSVLSPEKFAVFSYDLYTEHPEGGKFTLSLHLDNGFSWETEIYIEDTNFFQITDSDDGGIYILPLPSVDSFEEAVDTVS